MMMLTYNSIEIVCHNNLCSILLIYTIIIWHSKVYKISKSRRVFLHQKNVILFFGFFLSKCGF